MLIGQGSSRTDATDRRLACMLAAVAGGLNTAAFYAVGFFSANMTGNVSALSDHAARGDWMVGAFYLLIVVLFVLGAAISTLLINAGRRHGRRGIYALVIALEGALLALLGGVEAIVEAARQGTWMILGLSFLMGLQNAVVTRISDARVRTTHVSGMSTDIGIELAVLLDVLRGKESADNTGPYRSRLRLHVQTVLSFLLGGVVGVLLYQVMGYKLLFVAAAILLMMVGEAFWRLRRERPGSITAA
ncbi:YoaK family protein [Dyella sp.]|uniref:YoaK family protein n=1 Tax=Dyella sp. TaxID=1869338 RepID=UPI002ED00FA7